MTTEAGSRDGRTPEYLGSVLGTGGVSTGMCFQVAPGILVTSWHVLDAAGVVDTGADVQVDPLAGRVVLRATVLVLDEVHDLAVLIADVHLPAVAGPLTAADQMPLGARVTVHFSSMLVGEWAGIATRDDKVTVGRITGLRVVPGMSGAPVIRDSDGAVVGVVLGRTNISGGTEVWVARSEDVAMLVRSVANVDLGEITSGSGSAEPPEAGEQPLPPSSTGGDAQQSERRVLAGGISADLVDPEEGIPSEEDDLGVSTYVAMMATAIARKDTQLPLSIGLFGEWGSGKSYFMGLLRKQVKDLASSGDAAYCSGIEQIGFNAWSYADANLWASLGDEIFRQLAGPTDDEEEAEDRDRRERLRKWLAGEQGRVRELEAAKAAATVEVAKLRGELERREHDRSESALELLRATALAVQADEQMTAELDSAWDKLGLKDATEQARLLADAVTGTRDDVTAIRRAAVRGNRRYLVAAALAAGLALVITGLAASGVLGQSLSRWLSGTGLATLLAAAVTFATLTRRVADGIRSVADLANQIRQRTQAGANRQVRDMLDQVRAAEAREQVLQAQLDQVVARVGELGRELVELSPGQRLYAFIAERAASEDYRRQLGLIATIRRDFERLARLQEQWRNDTDGDSPRPIDRIVLYIDDLDRCTPRQVVEVLQAVHLLLALDLFVVVVGVDPRWLLHSLRDQYRSTLTAPPARAETSNAAEASAAETSRGRDDSTVQEDADRLMLSTPHDYLEKIFNVPFVLPAMTPQGFDTMIRRLSLTETDSRNAERPPIQLETMPAPQDGRATVITETNAPPQAEEGSEIAALQHGDTVAPTPLTEPELKALASLASLVRSPREAKRLLNLYRMLRSTRNLSDASRFLGGDGAEGEFQAVVMLLGLLTANPQLLGQILFAPRDPKAKLKGGICHRAGTNSWQAFLNGLRPRRVNERWRNDLCDGLSEKDRAEWELLLERARPAAALVNLPDLTTFKTWAPHVARFSFLLAPVTGGNRRPAPSGKPDSGSKVGGTPSAD